MSAMSGGARQVEGAAEETRERRGVRRSERGKRLLEVERRGVGRGREEVMAQETEIDVTFGSCW